MCEFISWIEHGERNYFLTNTDLDTKEGKKLLNYNVKSDLCGHGALISFYPELKGKGEHKECTDFSSTKNFPKEIVMAIKQGKLSMIGICLDVLNDKGQAEYEKIRQHALAEYEKIRQSSWAEYQKIEHSAWAEYEKIRQHALAEYQKIAQPAYAEYLKIEHSAYAEYLKIRQSSWAEYQKIEQPALAEYEKIEQETFSKIVKQKKYRNDVWK